MTMLINGTEVFPFVVHTGNEFIPGVNNTSGKFIAGVNNTSDEKVKINSVRLSL
jgi:hypothetical protein